MLALLFFCVKVDVSLLLVQDGIGAEASNGDKQELGANLLVLLFPQQLLLVFCLLGTSIFLST